MIKYSPGSGIFSFQDGKSYVRGILLSSERPSSLEITGADVDGLNDDDIIAAGSVLITPNANFIAFEDGVFTEKA